MNVCQIPFRRLSPLPLLHMCRRWCKLLFGAVRWMGQDTHHACAVSEEAVTDRTMVSLSNTEMMRLDGTVYVYARFPWTWMPEQHQDFCLQCDLMSQQSYILICQQGHIHQLSNYSFSQQLTSMRQNEQRIELPSFNQ